MSRLTYAPPALLMGALLCAVAPAPALACTVVKADPYAAFWRGPDAPKPRHPLWGQILFDGQLLRPDTQACETSPLQVMTREITAAAADGGIILLGEVHDNGEHHKVRAEIVRQISSGIAKYGSDVKRVPLVFEHIRTDQQTGLDQFRALKTGASADLFRYLSWEKSGWPDQKLFAPLFDAAIAAKAPIIAGDPSKAAIRGVAKSGLTALDAETLKALRLDRALDAQLQQDLIGELYDGHCGLMPKERMTDMASAQRYHDAHLASATLAAAAEHGAAIVLTGNGHVRTDRGVLSRADGAGPAGRHRRVRRDRGRQDRPECLRAESARRPGRRNLRRLHAAHRPPRSLRRHARCHEEGVNRNCLATFH
jgi:uncharacterized iron-regulated protein